MPTNTASKRKCPVMKAFTIHGTVVAVFCGSWSCPRCAKMNARKWAWRTALQMNDNPAPYRFWTLTMPGGMRSPWVAFQKLPEMWDAMRKTMQRQYGAWLYLAFVEGQAHRNGMPHFHVITGQPAPYRLKDLAAHLGFGYQAWDVLVNSSQGAQYVAKYASKGDPAMPRNFRRVRACRAWEKLPNHVRVPYICQRKGEDLAAFLVRVSEETPLSVDDAYEKWSKFDLRQITL